MPRKPSLSKPCSPLAKKRKKSATSRGTKANPRCCHCHGFGHYTSKCPKLAAELLKAVSKQHGSQDIQAFLKDSTQVKLVGCRNRRLRTLKKAKGKRFFRSAAASSAGGAKKSVRKSLRAKARNVKEKRARNPRAYKKRATQTPVSKRSVNKAYKYLKDNKLCWKPPRCDMCGGKYMFLSHKHNQLRGHGRKFVRCEDCLEYKDVLVWSHLPAVRVPLPALVAAIQMYFEQTPPPSSDAIGKLTGLSGTRSGALRKVLGVLQDREADCAVRLQQAGIVGFLPWWIFLFFNKHGMPQ